jgi:DNA-binding transcriptional LysR family regulator
MSHRQIEAFRAVMTSRTMTEASHLLRTSQSAVSRLITDLERQLGLSLFERRHGRISPTPEGLKLFEEVERSFISLDTILQFAAEIRDFREAQITVAAMPALCLDLVPLTVARFLEPYPKARIAVHARSSRQVVDWIISQQAELGLATPPYDLKGVSVVMRVETPCVCLLPTGHRLAGKSVIGARDLRGEPMILVSNSTIRSDLEQVFHAAGERLEPVVETPLSIVAARHVELGLGVSVIDPYTAGYCDNRGIVVRPFEAEITFVFGLLRPDGRPPSKALSIFQAMLEEQLSMTELPAGARPKLVKAN